MAQTLFPTKVVGDDRKKVKQLYKVMSKRDI